ncbi:MAG: type 1 glutamine amidotransferase [Phycisphaerae bacterium]
MSRKLRFLIIDGYPKASRDELVAAGCSRACDLYGRLVKRYCPGAEYDHLFPGDLENDLPTRTDLETYAGVLWTGCNLTIFDDQDRRVTRQVDLAKTVYEIGIPQFGSCWGVQLAIYAAGGICSPNPKGREIGLARKITLTPDGRAHPMYDGKPAVFDGYISHDDEVTHMPPGALHLAGNAWTKVQAVAVRHKNGSFWATQYHPEYDLREIARLIYCRAEKLIKYGFFQNRDEVDTLVARMEALQREPDRKDLRWSLAIDDDVLSDELRHCEFVNWLNHLVVPVAR